MSGCSASFLDFPTKMKRDPAWVPFSSALPFVGDPYHGMGNETRDFCFKILKNSLFILLRQGLSLCIALAVLDLSL